MDKPWEYLDRLPKTSPAAPVAYAEMIDKLVGSSPTILGLAAEAFGATYFITHTTLEGDEIKVRQVPPSEFFRGKDELPD